MRSVGRDQDGVSPIIGVILMTGIVVVVASIVFVVGGTFTKNPGGTTPQVTFTKMASSLQVVTSPNHPTVDWSALLAKGTCAGHLVLAPLGGAPISFPTAPGYLINPGDQLQGCGVGESLILAHPATNTVVYTFNF
jgi:hypothetical protein